MCIKKEDEEGERIVQSVDDRSVRRRHLCPYGEENKRHKERNMMMQLAVRRTMCVCYDDRT